MKKPIRVTTVNGIGWEKPEDSVKHIFDGFEEQTVAGLANGAI